MRKGCSAPGGAHGANPRTCDVCSGLGVEGLQAPQHACNQGRAEGGRRGRGTAGGEGRAFRVRGRELAAPTAMRGSECQLVQRPTTPARVSSTEFTSILSGVRWLGGWCSQRLATGGCHAPATVCDCPRPRCAPALPGAWLSESPRPSSPPAAAASPRLHPANPTTTHKRTQHTWT